MHACLHYRGCIPTQLPLLSSSLSSLLLSQALDEFLRKTRAEFLADPNLLNVPFGGVKVIFIGNCLQMPPITSRIATKTEQGHLYMVPTEPSYVWLSPLLQSLPREQVLKVRIGSCKC